MLRLWPDQYRLGLFPKASWLRAGKREHRAACGYDGTNSNSLVEAAADLLKLEPRNGYWRPSIDVTLSDQAARITLLPWQDRLRTSAQMTRYAEACLADNGAALGDEWVVKACFRGFGLSGLALALRREPVEGLVALARANKTRLRSVLPLSLTAYWSYRGVGRNRDACLLLHEANRLTAFRYFCRRLISFDVEPVVGAKIEVSLTRLLRRQCAQWSPSSIDYWSACPDQFEDEVLSRLLPDASVRRLTQTFQG